MMSVFYFVFTKTKHLVLGLNDWIDCTCSHPITVIRTSQCFKSKWRCSVSANILFQEMRLQMFQHSKRSETFDFHYFE